MRIESLQDLHLVFPDIDGFWGSPDLTQTENNIRSGLPPFDTSYGAEEVERLSQLGRVLSLQGKSKEALRVLEDCERRLPELPSQERIRPTIRLHLERGRYFCLSKFPSRAIEAFKSAWLASEKANMSLLLIETAYMFSITLPQKLRREWLMRALEITRNSQDVDSKKWFPLLLMSEAWHHFDAHRFEEALEIFRAAQNQCQEVENSNLRRILKWCEARALRALKQPDQALKIQEDILNTMDRPEVMDGFVYLEIAECWQDLHLKSKSQPYYEMALAALEKNTWYSDNYGHELSRIQKNAKKN